jgi:hypothetical protein
MSQAAAEKLLGGGLNMWFAIREEGKVFVGGKDHWTGAAKAAGSCPDFRADVEEEIVADEPVSCYNCRYRRWTAASFTCQIS